MREGEACQPNPRRLVWECEKKNFRPPAAVAARCQLRTTSGHSTPAPTTPDAPKRASFSY
ncbi:uncharacterized protein CELE_W01H2.2 [Caenorhabditis elegans]|uniref:Uncharacterized protein n=1 Tax=Caenorhabditis elegans TaxID=6239 RepID=O02045_CAEEL|nr:Uncharacterized protein CELE_W01H2.2 [Caenorhabditis elegans]CCD69765.1 Uncharacterized protein CELE_W01H2.2 [Caenorhabditis elegans]|eukprot:NP_508720.1 Uncharacterized protein CELE_W01H2.2 [Caenorhabditis elegans]